MREQRQKEAVDSWLKSKRNSIIYASPRMGKTKIGIGIIKNTGFKKVLVSYPNLPIKESWEADLLRWDSGGASPTFSTFLSLFKALEEPWELILLDEVHMLSEAQIEALKAFKMQFPGTQFLGLSGTISKETENILFEELDMNICYNYPIEQAVIEGIISDYQITVHQVPLDNKKVNTYYKKQVKRTEKQQFDAISKTIDYMEISGRNTFFKRLERMRLIQNSYSKLLKTKQLASNRALIFCGTTNIADQLGCATYHNKSNNKQTFEDFCNNTINQLAVCKMLNMGVTINNLDKVIINYTDSNPENLIQKICRCLNYDYHNKTAYIDIVSSNENIEIKWIKKALNQLDQSKISWI